MQDHMLHRQRHAATRITGNISGVSQPVHLTRSADSVPTDTAANSSQVDGGLMCSTSKGSPRVDPLHEQHDTPALRAALSSPKGKNATASCPEWTPNRATGSPGSPASRTPLLLLQTACPRTPCMPSDSCRAMGSNSCTGLPPAAPRRPLALDAFMSDVPSFPHHSMGSPAPLHDELHPGQMTNRRTLAQSLAAASGLTCPLTAEAVLSLSLLTAGRAVETPDDLLDRLQAGTTGSFTHGGTRMSDQTAEADGTHPQRIVASAHPKGPNLNQGGTHDDAMSAIWDQFYVAPYLQAAWDGSDTSCEDICDHTQNDSTRA